MKTAKCILCAAAVLFCVLVCGCSNAGTKTNEPDQSLGLENIRYGEISVDKDKINVILSVHNGKIYGYRMTSYLEFFTYDLVTQQCAFIGKTREFLATTMEFAVVGENIYLYLGDGQYVFLYEIDTRKDTVTLMEKERSSSPLVHVSAKSEGSLLTLIPEIHGDTYRTTLYEVFPGRKKNKTLISKECPLAFDSGEKILAFAYDTSLNELYVMLAYADGGDRRKVIERYDSQGNHLQSLPLASEEADYVTKEAIRRFSVTDGLIYIQNFSFEAVLIDYREETPQLLLAGDMAGALCRSVVQDSNVKKLQVFYLRDRMELLCIDPSAKEITRIDVRALAPKGEWIKSVAVDGDIVALSMFTVDHEPLLHVYSLEALLSENAENMTKEDGFPVMFYE